MKRITGCVLSLFVLCGCMSDKEFWLRRKQLENQAAHPSTYELFSVEGPIKIELEKGGKARVSVPNQPFKEVQIPDGVRTQAELVQHLINVGAISVLGRKAIDGAKGSTRIVNNNAAEAAGGAQ